MDIRNLVKAQVDLRIILKRMLSKEQRLLFELQKSRVVPSVTGKSSSSSDEQQDHMTNKKLLKETERYLYGFEMRTELDKRLLMGVLRRNVRCNLSR